MSEMQPSLFRNGDLLDVQPKISYVGTPDGRLIVANANGVAYYGPSGASYTDADGQPIERPAADEREVL